MLIIIYQMAHMTKLGFFFNIYLAELGLSCSLWELVP